MSSRSVSTGRGGRGGGEGLSGARGPEATEIKCYRPKGNGLIVVFDQAGFLPLEVDEAVRGGVLGLEVRGYFGSVGFGWVLPPEDVVRLVRWGPRHR